MSITFKFDPTLTPAWMETGPASSEIYFSGVNYCLAGQGSPVAAGGNFTVGTQFAFLAAATITGLRFWYPDVVSRDIKVSIWDNTGTRAATNTATYNTIGVKTITFGSPVSVLASQLYQPWYATTYETTGNKYLKYNTPANNGTNIFQPGTPGGAGAATFCTAFVAGPHYLFIQPAYAAGDVIPNPGNSGGTESFPVEPIFTVP